MTTQLGLFSNNDDREVKHKQPRARLPEQRGQMLLFSDREVLQFGVNAHPLIPLSPKMALPMLYEAEETETPEERAARMQREAEEKTESLF